MFNNLGKKTIHKKTALRDIRRAVFKFVYAINLPGNIDPEAF